MKRSLIHCALLAGLFAGTAQAQVQVGNGAVATKPDTIAVGDRAQSLTIGATTIGADALADGGVEVNENGVPGECLGATAVGNRATARGCSTTALGFLSEAQGPHALAIGSRAQAFAVYAVAVGPQAQATGDSAVAIGGHSLASGITGVAIGSSARALGDGGTAVGPSARANGNGGAACRPAATAATPSVQVGCARRRRRSTGSPPPAFLAGARTSGSSLEGAHQLAGGLRRCGARQVRNGAQDLR